MKPPFIQALPIIEKIEEAGFEAYFVGGSVRDLLLDRQIDDVDIATSATPEEVKAIFPKTVDVGIRHGTVIVLFEGEAYEITTFRTEAEYEDFRRPKEVYFIRSLKEDLQRRDFTMNAIAMDKEWNLIDPFNGQEDLKTRLIRTVGKPQDRFHEDALRMMRALRFMSQLEFSIDDATLLALKENAHLLEHIAMERIVVEFEKLLVGPQYDEALKLLLDLSINQFLPGLTNKGLEQFLKLRIPDGFSLMDRWVLLLYHLQLSKDDRDLFLRNWKISNSRIKRIQKSLDWLNFRLLHEWTLESIYLADEFVLGTQMLHNFLLGRPLDKDMESLQTILKNLPIRSRKELAVTGNDLMKWFGKKGGPWIEELLINIEKAVIYKKVSNNNQAIKEWLQACNHL